MTTLPSTMVPMPTQEGKPPSQMEQNRPAFSRDVLRLGISTDTYTLFHVDTSGPFAYVTFLSDKRDELSGFRILYQNNGNWKTTFLFK